ncbi:kinase-like protein [Gigaspora margarita]|uniref:Kinase-like protein n=1 Tax=Gigaspora margarita TaxID=4874 RepID=A0A8H4EL28_GIGMA|nr:kinase-like protein [Gigaspora margarita]
MQVSIQSLYIRNDFIMLQLEQLAILVKMKIRFCIANFIICVLNLAKDIKFYEFSKLRYIREIGRGIINIICVLNLAKDVKFYKFSKLRYIGEIGRGRNGIVYLATCYNEETIIFKRPTKIKKLNKIKQLIKANEDDDSLRYMNVSYLTSDPIMDVIQISRQIILGLQYLHSKKIIHGALHSKNILIQNGNFVILDFGTEIKFDDSVFSISQEVVMPEYIDPWYYIHEELLYPDVKSDIYSLGLIFWELTSGTPLFSNISNKLAIGWLIAYNSLRNESIPGTPSGYGKLCNECCVICPKNRPELDEIFCRVLQSKRTTEIITNVKNLPL